MKNQVETVRHCAILIAAGDGIQTYQSLDEVPHHLKRRLVESTVSPNSATLLIADRRGRKHLAESGPAQASSIGLAPSQSSVVATRFPWTEAFERRARLEARYAARPGGGRRWLRDHWPEVLVPAAVAGALWFLLTAF